MLLKKFITFAGTSPVVAAVPMAEEARWPHPWKPSLVEVESREKARCHEALILGVGSLTGLAQARIAWGSLEEKKELWCEFERVELLAP